MVDHLRRTARALNLPFGDRKRTFNSRLAQELGKWAESEKKGDAYHRAVFLAYFRDGRNIAKPSVLKDIAASVGLPGDVGEEIIASRRFRDAVDSDWSRSRTLKVTAVPSFRWKGQWLVGAQPYERLLEFISGGTP
jgi:predicted DsbA family dithiol-disulfide isomerase